MRIDLGSGCKASAIHTGSEGKFNECGYQQGQEHYSQRYWRCAMNTGTGAMSVGAGARPGHVA